MTPCRVLVADDHALTRAGIRQVLEEEPDLLLAGEAADGEECIRLTRQLLPDVLILDVNLPRRHGVEVLQELRDLPSVRVVILTGYDTEHYVETLVRLGARGYLTKSASSAEVLEAIRAVHAGATYFQEGLAPFPSGGASREPTPRELEVLRLVAEGHRNAAIAETLGISERTVQFHLNNLFAKLNVASRTQLIATGRQRGWVG